MDIRVRRGVDVDSYHHLLQATVKLKLRRTGFCKKTVQEPFNVHLLKEPSQLSYIAYLKYWQKKQTLLIKYKRSGKSSRKHNIEPAKRHLALKFGNIKSGSLL